MAVVTAFAAAPRFTGAGPGKDPDLVVDLMLGGFQLEIQMIVRR